jgi:hypothetical protein
MKQITDQTMSRPMRWAYIILLAVLVFTGFGQMPIFERYYVTSIPGLAWSGNFLYTINLHFVASALLIALLTYHILILAARGALRPPRRGTVWVRSILLALIIGSGFILIVRNISGVTIPAGLAVAASFAHIFGTMLFLVMAATYFRMKRAEQTRKA